MKEYALSQWGASRINDEGNSLVPSYDSTSSIIHDHLLNNHHHHPQHHHLLFSDDIDSNDIGNELNEISDPRDAVEDLALRKSKKKRSRKMKGKVSSLFFLFIVIVPMLHR